MSMGIVLGSSLCYLLNRKKVKKMEVRVLNNISPEDRARVVATAGSLSRFDGNVM